MQRVSPDELVARVARIFRAAGADAREAGLIAHQLVESDLCGHPSHGIGATRRYLGNIDDGTMILGQRLTVALDAGGMLICDAGLGAGQAMGHDALDLAIGRAREAGSVILSLRNSHHLGRIGHWAETCAEAGLVSIHFVNVVASPIVAVHGGKQGRLGTNPFAAGFPDPAGADPVIVDFATSVFAMGKVRVALETGETLVPGAILDSEGRPTTDPAAMFVPPIGTLLPFGGHKGSGFALACELFAAAMVGAPVQCGPMASTAIINSMTSVIVSPERIGTADAYAARLADLRRWLLSENEDGAAIMLAGTPERLSRERLTREGLPIDDSTEAMLAAAESQLGLSG